MRLLLRARKCSRVCKGGVDDNVETQIVVFRVVNFRWRWLL